MDHIERLVRRMIILASRTFKRNRLREDLEIFAFPFQAAVKVFCKRVSLAVDHCRGNRQLAAIHATQRENAPIRLLVAIPNRRIVLGPFRTAAKS